VAIWARRILILFCIGGGVMGVSTVSYSLFSLEGTATVVAALLVISIYVLGIVAGLALSEGRRNAMRLMMFFFAAQVPVVHSDVISFAVSALLSASLVLRELANFEAAWFFGTQWTFALWTRSEVHALGINAVPVALMVLLRMNAGIVDAAARE
jgi:hypothetical protein